MFNEKTSEYSNKQGKEIPVWQTPKYKDSRDAAVKIIESGKYGLSEADFWILMNETKSGKMAYTGLILSHNGCLKINDKLEEKFKPKCVSVNESGYGGSLVYTYNCSEQGLYEVGEVSAKNCKIDYPYAMAIKRLFDRVVLKLSKLAYSGIYGEDEADEFRNPMNEPDDSGKGGNGKGGNGNGKSEIPKLTCDECSKVVLGYKGKNGKDITPEAHIEFTKKQYGKVLCVDCAKKAQTKLVAKMEKNNADASN